VGECKVVVDVDVDGWHRVYWLHTKRDRKLQDQWKREERESICWSVTDCKSVWQLLLLNIQFCQ